MWLLAVAGAATGAVHFAVVPLPVIAVWGEPLRIEVKSNPAGADVILDGSKLNASTPIALEVRRDRRPHVLEVRKDGFRGTRQIIRFDRDLDLSISIALDAKSRPAVMPLPNVGQGATAAPGDAAAPVKRP